MKWSKTELAFIEENKNLIDSKDYESLLEEALELEAVEEEINFNYLKFFSALGYLIWGPEKFIICQQPYGGSIDKDILVLALPREFGFPENEHFIIDLSIPVGKPESTCRSILLSEAVYMHWDFLSDIIKKAKFNSTV